MKIGANPISDLEHNVVSDSKVPTETWKFNLMVSGLKVQVSVEKQKLADDKSETYLRLSYANRYTVLPFNKWQRLLSVVMFNLSDDALKNAIKEGYEHELAVRKAAASIASKR